MAPNVFTPNGDEKNDYFSPLRHQRILSTDMKIMNRWGGEVWHSDEAQWDGLINGIEANTGVYFWRILYGCKQDTVEVFREKKGYVHLMR